VAPPPSKSVTNRYLNLALLAQRPVTIECPLESADIQAFLTALPALGMEVTASGEGSARAIRLAPRPHTGSAQVDCAASGTMARFLTAALTTRPGTWYLDGTARLRDRPLGALLAALRRLGGDISELGHPGHLPLEIHGGELEGGVLTVDASESSQYLSALLMAATRAASEVEIEVSTLVSGPYVAVTREAVRAFGGRIERREEGRYRVVPGLPGRDRLRVEADWSAACYLAAAATLTGGPVTLTGLDSASAQADRAFLELLIAMGAEAVWSADGALVVSRSQELEGIDADLGDLPDQAPTLAAVAPFARGVTVIRNVGHLRLKESDRLSAVCTELRRCGVPAAVEGDSLRVPGVWAQAAPSTEEVTIDTHDDHRIAMSFAVLGSRRPGLLIDRPDVVDKLPARWVTRDWFTLHSKRRWGRASQRLG
jgi:3-phosphoshikimate 1-carboxyvinyltransferase